MTSDLDNLKQQWQSLNSKGDSGFAGKINPRQLTRHASSSNPQRIASFYRRMVLIGGLWAGLSLLLTIDVFPLWLGCLMSLFFLTTCFLNWRVMAKAEHMDLSSLSLMDAMTAVCDLQSTRRRCKFLGCVAAMPLLAIMFWYFYTISLPMFIGGIAGLIIGSVIGLVIDHRIRMWIDEMKRIIDEA